MEYKWILFVYLDIATTYSDCSDLISDIAKWISSNPKEEYIIQN